MVPPPLRIGGRGRDLAVPPLPAGGGASGAGALGCSDWSAGETPDAAVQPALAEGAAERPGGPRPLDRGDPRRAVTMTTHTPQTLGTVTVMTHTPQSLRAVTVTMDRQTS